MTPPPITTDARIGYVLKKFPRLSETFVLNELLGVERAGAEVTVFSLRPPDDELRHGSLDLLAAEVVRLHRRPKISLGTVLKEAADTYGDGAAAALADFVDLLPLERQVSVLTQGIALAEEVTSRRLDHLHAHFVTVAAHTSHVAHLITGVPYSITAHAKDIYRHGIDTTLFRRVVEQSSNLVTVCEANERHIRQQLIPGSDHPIVVIPNGLPDDVASHLPASTHREPTILAVGRLVEKKGFDVLIDACAELQSRGHDFSCQIAGGGDQFDRLTAKIDELGVGDFVTLLGPVTRERVLELMSTSRLLAVPCVTGDDGNRDALPTVVLEAMLVGLPVVATPVGGIEEMVRHGSEGLIVPERDVTALADAIGELLTDDQMWAAHSVAGPERVAQHFTQATTLPALLQVFDPVGARAR